MTLNMTHSIDWTKKYPGVNKLQSNKTRAMTASIQSQTKSAAQLIRVNRREI
jgi:hypothetical protein